MPGNRKPFSVAIAPAIDRRRIKLAKDCVRQVFERRNIAPLFRNLYLQLVHVRGFGRNPVEHAAAECQNYGGGCNGVPEKIRTQGNPHLVLASTDFASAMLVAEV